MNFRRHTPRHLYLARKTYFLTAGTYRRRSFFRSQDAKKLLRDVIVKGADKFGVSISAWVFLDNHYHLLLKLAKGNGLSRLVGNIHANSARLLNRTDQIPKRKVWYNYWDYCIRNDADYYRHLNYIHQNPVKHRYVNNLGDYRWSSYREYLERHGPEWLADSFRRFPIVDFTPTGEE